MFFPNGKSHLSTTGDATFPSVRAPPPRCGFLPARTVVHGVSLHGARPVSCACSPPCPVPLFFFFLSSSLLICFWVSFQNTV